MSASLLLLAAQVQIGDNSLRADYDAFLEAALNMGEKGGERVWGTADKAKLEELVKRGREGDLAAMESLYETFKGPVFGLVYRYAQNRAVAEDLLQDVFLKIFSHMRDVREAATFPGWVFRIALNTAYSHLRQKRIVNEKVVSLSDLEGRVEEPGTEPVERDLQGPLEEAIQSLDYRHLADPRIVFPALGLQFILLAVVLFADRSHTAHRWLHMGPANFQPSELSKLVLVLFLAYFLGQRQGAVNDWKHTLLPIGLVAGVSVALVVKEPDLGTSLALVLVVAAMLFAAGLRFVYFAAGVLAAVPVLYLLIFHSGYRYRRWVAFVDPYSDPLGKGFQIIQSFIAVGTGGIGGIGLMEGKQKLFYLPEPHTDFIFAVVSEELGFIGAMLVLGLFGVILWRGLRAAGGCADEFGRLLAVGLTVMLVGQAMVNISVVLGLLPTKGIPLPFVSYGGSSLLMSLTAVGILLNISQHSS